MEIGCNNRIRWIMLFFCFFPFIGLNIGTDTQPFALLCAIVLLLEKKQIKISYQHYFLFTMLVLTILSVVSLFIVEPFQIAKRLFSYVSVLLIPIAVYNSFYIYDLDNIEKTAKVFIIIWFIVGAVQTFIYSRFMTFIVPLYRTSETRGVCALASEPSFYGYMCFLFFLFALEFKKHKTLFCFLTIIQAIVFAQSSVTLVYFGVYAFCMVFGWLLSGQARDYIKVFATIFIVLAAIVVILSFFKTSRMGYLLDKMINNTSGFLQTDDSVEARWEHIRFSFSRWGIPYYLGTTQIMSGFGGAFYEMGLFSLSIFIPVIQSIYLSQNSISSKIGITLSIMICMLSAINLSSPMFAFYIGVCTIKLSNKEVYHD